MSTNDLDLDAIQQRAELTYREEANNDVQRLIDEIGRLRAERDHESERRKRARAAEIEAKRQRNRLRDGIRDIAGMHDGHDVECARCQAAALLDAPDAVGRDEVRDRLAALAFPALDNELGWDWPDTDGLGSGADFTRILATGVADALLAAATHIDTYPDGARITIRWDEERQADG